MASKLKVYVIRPVRNFIIYHLLRTLFWFGPLVPRKTTLWWHGYWAHRIALYGKKSLSAILDNLNFIFGKEKTKDAYRHFSALVYENLAKTFVDYALWSKFKKRKFFLKHFEIIGENYLKNAYDKKKGVLCLIPHTPGWEFSAILPPILGYKSAGVSSAIKNPSLNKLMINLRESRGMRNITRHRCYDELIQLLNNGECLIIMIDQDSMNIKGEFLDFMGHQAYTPLGCARLAMDTGAAVVPMYTLRNADNTYQFVIEKEIPPVLDSDGNYDIIANTQIHNDVISHIIMCNPTQWVWMHRRWNTTKEKLENFLLQKRKAKELEMQKNAK